MKGRLIFYCAAVVALVLFLAATSSHATERRDPVLNPVQTQPPSGLATVSPSHTRHVLHAQKRPARATTQKKSLNSGAGSASKGK